MTTTLRFLGTGAAGGTPGEGRSRRMESSALVTGARSVLVDVSRDLPRQRRWMPELPDAVVLTHGHRDAAGGIGHLRRWWSEAGGAPIPTFAAPETFDVLRRRYRRLDHLAPVPVAPGEPKQMGGWELRPVLVPHARDPRFPTYAWRLATTSARIVYASDVARLTADLAEASSGADLLALDGATWGRRIPWHLRVDVDLAEACRWDVERILLTQIGRSVPPHEELEDLVRRRCPKAEPAYDGLLLTVG